MEQVEAYWIKIFLLKKKKNEEERKKEKKANDLLKFLKFMDILHFFPKYPSAEDKKEKIPNINSQPL